MKPNVIILSILLALVTFSFVSAQQFYSPGNDVRCARMWDDINYNGNQIDCEQNERKTNLGEFDCKAESVVVRDGCTLTMFDKTGCRRTLESSASCLYGWNKRVAQTCCECDGCRGIAPRNDLTCARLYQHQKCSSCSGFRLEVNPMDEISNLNILNNQISSLIVKNGCELTVWEGFNYTGNFQRFHGPTDWLDRVWNDRISSLKCWC